MENKNIVDSMSNDIQDESVLTTANEEIIEDAVEEIEE